MAAPDRPRSALAENALAAPHRWSFFQMVRALLREDPGAPSPGGLGPAARENIRFRPSVSLGFPASSIESLEALPPDASAIERYRMTVTFMGLYGQASPLPNHYSEDFLMREQEHDPAREFLDLFHHRMISLFYRAWEKYRFPLRYREGGTDEYTRRALCLIGLGTAGMEAGGMPPLHLLRSAGLVADRHRSAAGLEALLRTHFDTGSLTVRACMPQRAPIPPRQRLRLGGRVTRLGGSAVLGERMMDRAGLFQIAIGPLGLDEFRRFLPGGGQLRRLVLLTRLYVRDPLDFNVRLTLRAAEVPAFRLAPAEALPLGHLSFLSPRADQDGQALISIKNLDPLRQRREAAPVPPPAPAAPRPRTTTTATGPGARSTPRVTVIRRN